MQSTWLCLERIERDPLLRCNAFFYQNEKKNQFIILEKYKINFLKQQKNGKFLITFIMLKICLYSVAESFARIL